MLSLHQALEIKESILAYLRATFTFQDKEVDQAFNAFLNHPVDGIFKGPYVSVKLPFVKAGINELKQIPLTITPVWLPYQHQVKAWQRLAGRVQSPLPTIITTGTGSGKTEAFLYPILDHCHHHIAFRGIKAIIMYPMNALATDQAKRLAEAIYDDVRLRGKVTAGLFIGEGQNAGEYPRTMSRDHIIENRQAILESPPDILLTNFKMLDYALMKQDYQALWHYNRHNPELLKFIVLDELHTYDGAQGTDVANLIRRVKLKLGIPRGQLCPVGTSATLGSGENATTELAEFASKIYGEDIDQDAIIGEVRLNSDGYFTRDERDSIILREGELQSVKPFSGEGYENYVERQMEYWQIEDKNDLAEVLGRSQLVRDLCDVVDEGRGIIDLRKLLRLLSDRNKDFRKISEWDEIHQYSPREALVYSLLSLLSEAKVLDEDTGRESPFVFVQVQLWIRELSGVLRRVSEKPEFVWREQSESEVVAALPPWFCRECGESGWLVLKHENKMRYEKDINNIYEQYFKNNKNIYFANLTQRHSLQDAVVIGYEPSDYLQKFIHDSTLEFMTGSGGVDITSFRKINSRGFSDHVCPSCNAQNNLAIIGTRIATLSSVSVSQSLATDLDSALEQERKVLAFTNSVQDAAHQAGFIQARNYRFTFRSSLQKIIRNSDDGIPLTEVAREFKLYWKDHADSTGKHNLEAYYYRFYPKDQIGKSTPENYKSQGAFRKDFIREFDLRMDWEIFSEFGYNAIIGRTLEKTGSSVVYVDQVALEKVFAEMRPWLDINDISHTITEANFHDFIRLTLYRIRVRGAVSHPYLKKFRSRNLKLWDLNWNKDSRHFLNPNFQPRARFPRLVTTDQTGSQVIDSTFTRKNNWFHHYFTKSFPLASNNKDFINEFFEQLFIHLEVNQVLDRMEADGLSNFAIRPECLNITKRINLYTCSRCNHSIHIPHLPVLMEGRCVNYRCDGSYEVQEKVVENYYQKVYNRNRAPRVYATDHTGLLDREVREALEYDFKNRPRFDSKNALVATSTLEMGIDIGSLNTAYNNEVPPLPSNFLQRIGRAGRSSGSALIINFVKNQSHDLYYFQDPLEMMDGEVHTPGCFLDAKEILRRHFFAYIIDNWVKDEENSIPPRVAMLKLRTEDPLTGDFFMSRIMRFFTENHALLTNRFFEMYESDLNIEVVDEFKSVIKDQTFENFYQSIFIELRNEIRQIEKQRQEIDLIMREQNLGETDPLRLTLNQEKRNLGGLLKSISDRQVLEHLTNVGALPNYAFPETGTTLNARVVGGHNDQFNDSFSKDIEIVRASSQALREFAPENTFFSQGYQLVISGVNTFDWSRAEVFHEKRFCSNCDHIAIVASEVNPSCPKCGDQSWSSESNKATFAKMTAVRSFNFLNNALVSDNKDDRDQLFYNSGQHFDFSKSKSSGSFHIEKIPFGIELLNQVNYIRTNLGRTDASDARTITINEKEVPRHGFVTCRSCGKSSSNHKKNDYQFHYPYCKYKDHLYDGRSDNIFEEIFFFREFQTEVIKVLLPVQEVNTAMEVNLFKSGIQLGLKKHYKGNPSHIKIENYREFNEVTGKFDHYLVLLDTIPGGTGYLSELFDWDIFNSIMQSAYDAVKGCDCQNRGFKGCYRCIYTYENQYIRNELDRAVLEQRLEQILSKSSNAQHSVNGLNKIANAGRVEESELETRFIAMLKFTALNEERYEMGEAKEDGKVIYFLSYKDEQRSYRYKIQPQVYLGNKDEVAYNTRTDFLMTCVHLEWEGEIIDTMHLPKFAIYLDGYQFHASSEHNRFGNDIKIRNSIRQSHLVYSWSLTWKDLSLYEEQFTASEENGQNEGLDAYSSLLTEEGYSSTKKAIKKLVGGKGTELFDAKNSVERLLVILSINGLKDNIKTSVVRYLSCFQKKNLKPSYDPVDKLKAIEKEQYSQYCFDQRTINGLLSLDIDSIPLAGRIRAVTNIEVNEGWSLVEVWDQEEVNKEEWENFLILYNLVQFYEEMEMEGGYAASEVLEYYEEPLRGVVKQMIDNNLIQSEAEELAMESLLDQNGEVLAEAGLIIHHKKIAIAPKTDLGARILKENGYQILTLEESKSFKI